jgi:anti-sigma factor RsiW
MNRTPCTAPVPFAALLDYWLGDLDAAREEAIERHLFGCGECCAGLERIAELAGGIRALLRRGEIAAAVTPAFVEALRDSGVRLREYGVPRNGSVHCTVAPDDDLLVARLQAPLAGVERLDLVTFEPGEEAPQRLTDIPFSAATGEVVLVPRVDRIRALGESTATMRLVAVEGSGERVLGEYRFLHTPWAGA